MKFTELILRIQEKENKDIPVYPELNGKTVVYAKASKCAILEGGTVNGNITVQLIGELASGEVIVLETTGKLFNAANSALLGAAHRFGETI